MKWRSGERNTRITCATAWIVLVGGWCAAADDYLSPVALVADKAGRTLYVAEATARQVAEVDLGSGEVKRVIGLPDSPSGLALSADGASLYVTAGISPGRVYRIDLKRGKIAGRVSVGHTPMAPVTSPDGGMLYVCNRFNNDVSLVDLKSQKEIAKVAVTREPVAASLTPDGKLLFVANHLPAGAADGAYSAAVVSVIDTAARKAIADILLPNGSTGLRGICMSPDGAHAYVTHLLARYQLPTTQVERGWMNTNALSIIDVARQSLLNTVLLDDVDLGAANPWGTLCTADGKWIAVAHAGTHQLSVIDRAALHEKLAKVAAGQSVSDVSKSANDVPNDLSFLYGLRRRLALAGNGPRAVAGIGGAVYVAEYFSDTLGAVDVEPTPRHKPRSLALGPERPPNIVRKGEMFFNDARFCFQQWQSCASCHPDARADGLNWDLLNDDLGNPKNTKSMLLAHQTPPAMASGVRDKAETAVRAGLRFIQFSVRPEEDAVAIDEYLKSLRAVPSPYLDDGKLSRAANRGRKVFEKAGCARCHPAPLLTNLKEYDVGTGKGVDKDKAFDTPTLVEVWRTAPYLHDGRATTMQDVLRRFNAGDKHGSTASLSESEIGDLAEFILSQ